MEEYLTTEELSQRIKMAPGSIRNLVWRNQLEQNVHYVKPTPKKLLFIWSQIEKWLYGDMNRTFADKASRENKSLINI